MTESDYIYEIWHRRANQNVDEWGVQDPAVILLAMQEELGEMTQAYLEATYQDGDQDLPPEQIRELRDALTLALRYRGCEDARE